MMFSYQQKQKEPKKKQKISKKCFEQQYFQETIPFYLSKYLESRKKEGEYLEQQTLGNIQHQLWNLSKKYIIRKNFVEIFKAELKKQFDRVCLELNNSPDCFELLKDYVKIRIYLWKLEDEIKNINAINDNEGDLFHYFSNYENEKGNFRQGQDHDQHEERQGLTKFDKIQLEQFNRIFWIYRVSCGIMKPNTAQLDLINLLRQVADSLKITKSYRERMKHILDCNYVPDSTKLMKILGESTKQSENQTPQNSQSPSKLFSQPSKIQSKDNIYQKQPNTAESKKYANEFDKRISEAIYEVHKIHSISPTPSILAQHRKISKNRALALGRTLYFSHPLKYHTQVKKKVEKTTVYYAEDSHMQK